MCWYPVEGGLLAGSFDGMTHRLAWPEVDWMTLRLQGPGACNFLNASDRAGLFLRTSWGQGYQLRDLSTGQPIFKDWGVWPMFDDAGTRFAVSLGDRMRFYRVLSRREFFESGGVAADMTGFSPWISPKGDLLAAGSSDGIVFFDARTLNVVGVRKVTDRNVLAFLSDGRVAASIANKLAVFKVTRKNDGTVEMEYPTFLTEQSTDWMVAAAKADRLAWRAGPDLLRVGAVATRSWIDIKTRSARFGPLGGISPDGRIVAVSDGTVRIFSAETGELIHDFGAETTGTPRTYFEFSPDSRMMIGNTAEQQLLFDLERLELVRTFPSRAFLGGAGWSPDGSILARVADQESLTLHDARDYAELARLRLPRPGAMSTVRFSPDGQSLYVCVDRQRVHRWNLPAIRRVLDSLGLNW